MLEQKVILYDDSCPMCKLYTQGFVSLGILRAENRVGFANAPSPLTAPLDLNRARHHIPLMDLSSGEIVYGLDALFVLVGHKLPALRPLFRFWPLRFALRGLYTYITYNRRVLAGTSPPKSGFDCGPDFHLPMRLTHILLALTGWLLLTHAFWQKAQAAGDRAIAVLLFSLTALEIVLFLAGAARSHRWDYAGTLATGMLCFGLLLTPAFLFPAHPVLLPITLMAAALVGALDHWRRWQAVPSSPCGRTA